MGKIYGSEGVSGLYRGFWVSSVQIVSGVMYIATYEGVRHILSQHNVSLSTKSLVGGGCASVVGQTIIVPFDIMSQHLMVLGLAEAINKDKVSRSIHTGTGNVWIHCTGCSILNTTHDSKV